MNEITRRGFFVTGGVLVGLLTTAKLSEGLSVDHAFLRPPGAVEEPDFLARCIRCQKCLAVCPPRIIQSVSITESIIDVGTPYLDFSKAYCDFCESTTEKVPLCASVCPTAALSVPTEKPQLNGIAVIDKDVCIAWNWMGCTICVNECPQEAIYFDDQQRPVVDIEACDGCGLCEYICPSASLRTYRRSEKSDKGIIVEPGEGGAR